MPLCNECIDYIKIKMRNINMTGQYVREGKGIMQQLYFDIIDLKIKTDKLI